MNKLSLYDSFRQFINTGDVLAFSGTDKISKAIQCTTNSDISHVGLALWVQFQQDIEPKLFVCESTTLNNVKDVDGTHRCGVQIVSLSQKIDAYSGNIYWYSLKEKLNENEKLNMSIGLIH